jgi:replicative DNA helicase
VFEIAEQETRGGGGFQPLKTLLGRAVERIEVLFQRNEPITGLPSGFTDFDKMTSGMQPSDLIIVAGRPSMGKTTFAMNLAENVGLEVRRPVAIFSMEMPGDALAMRMMSSLGRIDQHRVRTGRLEDDEWPRLTSAVNMLAEAPMFIDDTPALSPTELRARARRLKREHGDLALIVIDYLQLMQAPTVGENRATEISAISRSLKALAKELSVPVIALSQLNRSLEQRPNKRPVMSDLRESGAIEQDADLIVFIYRDEVYHEDTKDKGIAEIIIGKQRNGPIGTLRLTFLGKYTKFESFIADTYGGEDY